MQVKLSRAKNLIIIALVIMCLVQIGRVWFGDSVNQRLFVVISKLLNQNQGSYAYAELVKPYRLVLNNGKPVTDDTAGHYNNAVPNGFIVKYNGLGETYVAPECDKALKQLLKTGEFLLSEEINYYNYFTKEAVMYEYKFPMPADTFCRAFSQPAGFITSRIKHFNAFIAIPGYSEEDGIIFYFLDYSTNTAFKYRVERYDGNISFLSAINSQISEDIEISYFMSGSGASYIKEGLLIAILGQGNQLKYPAAVPVIPYENNGDIRMAFIESKVAYLFENPNAVWSDLMPDDVFIFREGKSVVKYTPDNVLEYTNYSYSPASNKKENSFISAYSAAIGLLKRDETIINEYYLAGYEENEDTWSFYFDLCVNDFPISMRNNFKNKISIGHAMEVTVVNDVVVKYKRLIYNFATESDSVMIASKNFLSAYTDLNGVVNDTDTIITADLGYSIDPTSIETALKLTWFFETKSIDSDGVFIMPSTCPAQ